MSTPVVARELGEADYAAWNEMVAKAPGGSVYSTPEYLDILAGETDGRFRIIAADRCGEILGGIALLERKSAWGSFVSGRYLLYYNGFVVKPHASKYPSERTSRTNEVLSVLEAAVRERGYGRVRVRSRGLEDIRVFLQQGWRMEPSYTYIVPLNDLTQQWTQVEQNLRRLVKRCGEQGICFTEDDDFQGFHRLHTQTASRKGSGIYLPPDSFLRYFRRLRDQGLCRLYHARLPDGRSVSSQLVLLGKHPVSHTVSAASDGEHLKTGAAAFLRWKTFEDLASLGYQANDLTDAELNPVTHFKGQLGGNLHMNFVLTRPDNPGFALQQSLGKGLQLAAAAKRKLAGSLQTPVRSAARRPA